MTSPSSSKFNRVTLKLGLAFSALIAILLGVGWLGLDRLGSMNGEVQEIVDRRWHKVQLSREALHYSALNSRITMQVFLLEDRAEIDPLLTLRASNTARISVLLKQIEAEMASELEKKLIADVWTTRIPYVESYKRALSLLLEQGQPEAGRVMMAKVVLPNLIAYHKAWEAFVQMQGEEMDKAGDVVEIHYRTARQQVFGLLALSTLLGVCIAVFVTRNMTREMKQRQVAERALFDAHAELEERVEERTSELKTANYKLHTTAFERAAALQELQTSEQRFRMLSTSAPIGIFETDAEGLVLYANPRWEEITGLPPSESLGSGWQQVVHPDDVIGVLVDWNRASQTALPFEGELRFRRTNGEVRWIHLRTVPVWAETGEIVGHVGTAEDVTERKHAIDEIEKMHGRLVQTSRQAGMAEVATSVLHNVGNVLNSVNVSSECLAASVRKSKGVTLARVVAMLREHQADLSAFFSSDPRAKQLPDFLGRLADRLAGERASALEELGSLQKNIEHIKEIVSMQQAYAQVSGITEIVQITDLIEDTLRMNTETFARHDVQVVREFSPVPPVTVEKHKVLQILVNLVRNAKHACEAAGRPDKRVTLRVFNGNGRVKISVSDNGVGIPPENLVRVFNHGFTTKKDGHGFGLHSGALAAKEMGGALSVTSEGQGAGATFTLELPIGENGKN